MSSAAGATAADLATASASRALVAASAPGSQPPSGAAAAAAQPVGIVTFPCRRRSCAARLDGRADLQ